MIEEHDSIVAFEVRHQVAPHLLAAAETVREVCRSAVPIRRITDEAPALPGRSDTIRSVSSGQEPLPSRIGGPL